MAAYNENTRDPEFEAAFNEDAPSAAGGETGGLNLPEAGEGTPVEEAADAAQTVGDSDDGGTPAVMIVAEVDPGAEDAASEKADNDAAAKDAKAVNDAANADASDNKSPGPTTGEREANGGSTPAEGSAAEEALETPAEEASEQAAGAGDAAGKDPYDLSDVPPEDMQKAKSWVGRLKKIEADLKARSGAAGPKDAAAAGDAPAGADANKTADAIEQVSLDALAQGKEGLADAADQVADQVAAGELTPQQAMEQLSADFGESFIKLIEVVARNAAGSAANQAVGDRLGKLEQDTQGVIDHLASSAQRSHFQQIYDQHPDFQAVSEEPGFNEFVQSTGQQAVVDNGSAAAINKLIADYKATKQAPAVNEEQAAAAQPAATSAPVDQGAVDAAEGVRSAGLRLPEKPGKANDDFASAWEQF